VSTVRAKKRPGPEGGVRDENRRRRTGTLLTAAGKLFLRRGLEQVTIDDITAAARMAKGGYYRYFDDKDALVKALFAPIAARIEEVFSRCQADLAAAPSLAAIGQGYLTLAADLATLVLGHPLEMQLYLQECRGPATGPRRPVSQLSARITELSLRVTQVAIDRGLMRPFSNEVVTRAVIGATESIIHAHLTGASAQSAASLAPALIELFLHGVARR
jgi:AcrR family transcriptional regulator